LNDRSSSDIMIRLRFVADDYGKDYQSNQSIEMLCRTTFIKEVSVLAADECNYSIQEFGPHVNFGAHLFLTEFKPLLGLPRNHHMTKYGLLYNLLLGSLTFTQCLREFKAQFEKLIKMGLDIRFIDTHQNIHILPVVFAAVKQIAATYGIENKIRPFTRLDFRLKLDLKGFFYYLYALKVEHGMNTRVLINCPGYRSEDIDLADALSKWNEFLKRVKTRDFSEIIVPCHPGCSPAEVQLYSSKEFVENLKTHAVVLQ